MSLTDRSLLAKLCEEVESRAKSYSTNEWWRVPGGGILVIACDQITSMNPFAKPTFTATDHLFFEFADMFVALTANATSC